MINLYRFKKSLFKNKHIIDCKLIMSREYEWSYSKFWDSIRINFDNGDKIGIFCKAENHVCRFYSAQSDGWLYMSGEHGKKFIENIKAHIYDEELMKLLTW